MGIRMVGSELLEVLFPGRCLLCGRWLLAAGSSGAPVCAQCRCSLRPLRGSRCQTCGMPLVSEHGVCTRCREAGFSFASHRSLFSYSEGVRELISCLKFEHRSRLAGFFADLVAERIASDLPRVPLVPVPGRRSADAVELIARKLSAEHGITVLRVLARAGGRQQKSLNLEERRENLRGRVSIVKGPVPPQVILFDDIFTTGATADACARVLVEGGCGKVSVITLAQEE